MGFLNKIIKKIINSKFVIKNIDYDRLHQNLNLSLIERNEKWVKKGNNSFLYAESTVSNFQQNKEKIEIGNNTHVRGELLVFAYGGKIKIGDNCYVGANSHIWSGESVEIGNNVLISHNVNIIDSDSHEKNNIDRAEGFIKLIQQGHPKEKGSILTAKISIKDYAWINFNSIILKGITIGEGAIVAAGAVVTKDVPPFTMVAGNPAKEIKKLLQK
jgi:acetyltransferase-like isoleucine patch superfamily enzyme